MLEYGLIGNCHTSALVSEDGDINWMCYPTFQSPTVFGNLLDGEGKGGTFALHPHKEYETTQYYLDRNAILITDFIREEEAFRVFDFFPRYRSIIPDDDEDKEKNFLIRIIKPLKGTPRLSVTFAPKPQYGRIQSPSWNTGRTYTDESETIHMKTNAPSSDVTLDRTIFFGVGDSTVQNLTMKKVSTYKRHTENYWRDWVNSLVLPRKNRETIIRSAITIKLLTYDKTGAIVAAPTTSLPEELGSERCWDYRYCWIRDSSFAVDALKKIGRGYESKRLMEYLMDCMNDTMQPFYGIECETNLEEEKLQHLSGFKGNHPVRIGNQAYEQGQHDIYGELIDVMYLYFTYYEIEQDMPDRYWSFLRKLVGKIENRWEQKDLSIWEMRSEPRHYTFSKLMCFIGVDRAIKIAESFGRDELVDEWSSLRVTIKEDLLKKGFDEDRQAFTISYDSDALDASLLRMTYHEFLDADDERLKQTVHAVHDELSEDYLVKRYDIDDGLGESSSAFTICSFWLIDSLYYIGEEEKARELFNALLEESNHLGLFSEDIGLEDHTLLGNFPQAYTHIALINTSILLSEWSTKRKEIDWNLRLKKSVY